MRNKDYSQLTLEAELSNTIWCAKDWENYFFPLSSSLIAAEEGNCNFILILQQVWSNWLAKRIKLSWMKISCGGFRCLLTECHLGVTH